MTALLIEFKALEVKYHEKCNEYEALRISYSKLDSQLVNLSLTHVETSKFEEMVHNKNAIVAGLQKQLQEANN